MTMRKLLTLFFRLLAGRRRQRPIARRQRTLASLQHEQRLARNPAWQDEMIRRGQTD
jgi:hypothetical protein